ncbi:MAG: glycosyltransferase, partial [Prevotella sp.]
MNVLVIIVSYNFMPWIDRCLDSLRQSQLKADVMVIDNASADATVDTVRKRYPEVKLV